MKQRLVILVILTAIAVLTSGCCISASHPPGTGKLTAESSVVSPSDNCQIEYVASESGGALSYGWWATGGTISGKGSSVIWAAPDESGEYTISVNVMNEEGESITESVTITVRGNVAAANHPPEITNLNSSAELIIPAEDCIITCLAQDPDGDKLSYVWSSSGGSIAGEVDSATWTASDKPGIYSVSVEVIDENDGRATSSIAVTVRENHPPDITSLVVDPSTKVKCSTVCIITCLAQDIDGDELSYEWSVEKGGLFPEEDGTAVWMPPKSSGTYDIVVVVRDIMGGKDDRIVQIKVGSG